MVEPCILYLESKSVVINDAKLFDQFHRLTSFVESQDEHFDTLLVHEKWTLFFKAVQAVICFLSYWL